jgi:hypothetical protein
LQLAGRLTKPVEPDICCNPNWELFYRDARRDFYTMRGIERFD